MYSFSSIILAVIATIVNSIVFGYVASNSNFMDVQGGLIKCKAILTSKIRVFLIDTDYEFPVIYSS